MSYAVKEIFYTLQGEGLQAGRPAVFCRFSGCNLWSGREADRGLAQCTFCDTDFVGTDGVGGGKFTDANALADAVSAHWGDLQRGRPMVVLTGGEPLLQVDAPLINALHDRGFWIALETNGTVPVPDGIDWVCVSPKAGNPLLVRRGDELKVVVPQAQQDLASLAALPFSHHLLQPMDGLNRAQNTAFAVDYCLRNPKWRLSLQTHKVLGIQ